LKTKQVVVILVLVVIFLATVLPILRPAGRSGHDIVSGSQPIIAIVRLDGVLATGFSGAGSALASGTCGSDTVVATLAELRRNPTVKAVVLRLNSPGGSPAAAQEICEELALLRLEGKTVVTSMADTAASGAYWIAANTDHIFANAGTLTGSIGVIWQVANYEELYRKLGIEYLTLTSGPYKDMGSSSRPMTDAEKEILRSMIQDLYDQFVDTVAAGRNLPREAVLAVADGRVFTGSQAMAVGLVDSLGGLTPAVKKAADLAGVADSYRVQEFGRRTYLELLLGEASALLRSLRSLVGLPGSGLLNPVSPTGSGEGPK